MDVSASVFIGRGDTFEAAESCGEPVIRCIRNGGAGDWPVTVFFGNAGPDGKAEAVRQLRELAAVVNIALNMAVEAMPAEPGPDDPTDEPTDEPATGHIVMSVHELSDADLAGVVRAATPWPSDPAGAAFDYHDERVRQQVARIAAQAPEWPRRIVGDQATPKGRHV